MVAAGSLRPGQTLTFVDHDDPSLMVQVGRVIIPKRERAQQPPRPQFIDVLVKGEPVGTEGVTHPLLDPFGHPCETMKEQKNLESMYGKTYALLEK